MLSFEITKRTDPRLLKRMETHYSQPKGFVGRNICLAIYFNSVYYGHIVFGSATQHLPGRDEFFGGVENLNTIANNIFYNISKVDGKYPLRNFTTTVLIESMKQCKIIWKDRYGEDIIGFETLVEPPRTGELYLKAGFTKVGVTKGFTCKRVGGKGYEKWGGQRVWNKKPDQLRPKNVFCRKQEIV